MHPFIDGNGRTARLATNCVLSAAGLSRIIVPTVYREDYLLPLKAPSNNADVRPFVAAMTRIQSWSAAFDHGLPRNQLRARLAACHAFEEDLKAYRLVFPRTAWVNAGRPPPRSGHLVSASRTVASRSAFNAQAGLERSSAWP